MTKAQIKKYDKIWSQLILFKYPYCPRCGSNEAMSPHHIIKRRKYSTRWDLRNGIGLCRRCHCFAENWSVEFTDWLLNYKAKKSSWSHVIKWFNLLVRKGNQSGNKLIIEKDLRRLEKKWEKYKNSKR